MKLSRAGAALGLVLMGCHGEEPPSGPRIPSRAEPVVALSSPAAAPGSRIAVALRLEPSSEAFPGAVGALQGWIRFDPTALRYIGQPAPRAPAVLTGEREIALGKLKLAVLDIHGLSEQVAVLVFEVLDGGYARDITFETETAVSRDGQMVRYWPARIPATPVADLPVPDDPRRLTLADWAAYFAPASRRSGPLTSPGDGFIFGDATLDGALNVLDVLGALNVAAGNVPLLTLVSRDFAVAADVAPDNAPGIGAADDPVPPGLEADGTRVINVLDGLAIANAVAGNPTPIAGQQIPGRLPTLGRVVLNGVLLADRVLSRDTVYELNGTVSVEAGVTLTIGAGTRIEGQSTSRGALVIRRNGHLQALGTRLEPIVFACTAANPSPGCWGGVSISGSALLNNSDFGGGGIGCPEKVEPSGSIYGGCLVQHSSGSLRFVRIEHSGAPWPGSSGSAAGLALNGVGSGTILEDIQVLKSSGAGIFVSGGHAALREAYLAQNGGDGLAWDDGWQGKAQSILIARSGGTGAGLRGSNFGGNPFAGPRSHPTMHNVTIVEVDPAAPPGAPAVLLAAGTGGVFRNVLVQGWTGVALEISDAATCARIAADSLDVSTSIFFGNGTDFSADADCVDEFAFGTASARQNLQTNPFLLNPAFSVSPDYRPANGSPAEAGAMPPSDGFFDVVRSYRGAVPIAGFTRANIPWYAGWTVGF